MSVMQTQRRTANMLPFHTSPEHMLMTYMSQLTGAAAAVAAHNEEWSGSRAMQNTYLSSNGSREAQYHALLNQHVLHACVWTLNPGRMCGGSS
jgi:hypothetical protein